MTNSSFDLAGAHERHLLRKSNNPLFGSPQFTSEDLERTRLLDQDELNEFIAKVQRVVMQCLQLGETAETEDILRLKEQLDALFERSCGLAGDLSKEQQAIQSVITPIMHAIEKNAANDPNAMQKLKEEKAARKQHMQLLENKLMCDLLRANSTIGESELTATLLCEPLDSMRPVLDFFNKQQLQQLEISGHELIAELALNSEHSARGNLAAIEQHIDKQCS